MTGASWEGGVYSVPTDLNAEADGAGTPTGVVYLKFPPVGGVPGKALLRLHTATDASAAGGSGQVCRVDDDSWNENTLTWANRPTVSASCVGPERDVEPDNEVLWDVTSLVAPAGNVNLAVVSHSSNGVHYLSKEASATEGPRLYSESVGPAPGLDAGTPAGLDAAAAAGSDASQANPGVDGSQTAPGADGSQVAAGDGGHGSGKDAGAANNTTSGACGCASAPGGAWALAGILALLGGARRRRHARRNSDRFPEGGLTRNLCSRRTT